MKLVFAMLFATLSVLSLAQTDIASDRFPVQPVIADQNAPILVRIRDNKWGRETNIFADQQLIAMVGEMLQRHNWTLAAETEDILHEASERRAMAADEYVDTSSTVFKKHTIKPAEWILEVTTGGSDESHQVSNGIRIGRYEIGGQVEAGSSTAYIYATLIKRDTFIGIGTIVGKSTYKSVNVDSADIARTWEFSSLFRFDRSNDDPRFRRGMISIGRAMEMLDQKLSKLFTTSR